MPYQHYILGTAGHIDHGKSTLVEALTGTNPDRLPEERERGMTIDLGFANLLIEDPEDKNSPYNLGIVDVPGHADFVKNMVAGVGSIDLALLIISADDGWMPQTEEHLQILTYLNIDNLIITLTKSDLMEDRDLLLEDIQENLQGSPFENAPLVETCALSGEGLDTLKQTIVNLLKKTPPPQDNQKPRLHVDRVFSPKGIGTVVTGTLSGGKLKKGQEIIVQPHETKSTIRNIQSHSHQLEEALPGTRTALNLSDVAIYYRDKKGIRRGDTITIKNLGSASSFLDVHVRRLKRKTEFSKATARSIKHGQKIRFHHGGTDYESRIYFPEKQPLNQGEETIAQLRFESPVYGFIGDHFVLRDWGKQATLGGGTILALHSQRKNIREKERYQLLQKKAQAIHHLEAFLECEIEGSHFLPAASLFQQSHFTQSAVEEAIATLSQQKRLFPFSSWIISFPWWRALIKTAKTTLEEFHQHNPELPALRLTNLKNKIAIPDAKLLDLFIQALEKEGFVKVGNTIRLATHTPQLPHHLKAAAERIKKTLSTTPTQPPNLSELITHSEEEKALHFLLNTGHLIELTPKLVISVEGVQLAKEKVINFLQKQGTASASELRQAIGTNRKTLIPLLEFFDKENLTVREGERRSLKQS